MDVLLIGIIGITSFVVLILIGVPIAISSTVVGCVGIVLLKGFGAVLTAASSFPFFQAANFTMSVVPMFILMGLILFNCGVADQIFNAARQWMGHLPGGLAASTTFACAIMGTCTGSSIATTALMAKLAYPQMRRYGYAQSLAFGVVASSGSLASIIPPSIVIVIYGVLANQSIGDVLIAGVIPGFTSAFIFMIMIFIRCRLNPSLGAGLPAAPWRTRFVSLRYLIPAAIMFAIIVIGIYNGIFTATEAGCVAVMVSFIIVLILKRLTWSKLKDALLETVRLTVMVITLIVGISFLTRFLTYAGVTVALAELALKFPSPAITLILQFFVYLILGMFIDASGMMMISVPLFVPVIIALGYDPVWYGILVVKMTEVAMISPPVGGNVFVTQGIVGDAEITLDKGFRAIVPFFLCDILIVLIMVAYPPIVTWLPSMMHR